MTCYALRVNTSLCGLASTDLVVGLIVQPLFVASSLTDLHTRSEKLKLTFRRGYNPIGFSLCVPMHNCRNQS